MYSRVKSILSLNNLSNKLCLRTLFGQMVCIFSLGILLAGILTAWLTISNRQQMFFELEREQTLLRITNLILAFDNLGSEQRNQIIDAISNPYLAITIEDEPKELINKHINKNLHAQVLEVLNNQLDDNRPVIIDLEKITDEAVVKHIRDHMHKKRLKEQSLVIAGEQPKNKGNNNSRYRSPELSDHRELLSDRREWNVSLFSIQVELADGQWILFERLMPLGTQPLPKGLGMAYGLSLLIMIILAVIASKWVTRPLEILSRAAEKLGRDINSPPLKIFGCKEVKNAAQAFNTMQIRIKRYVDDRENLLAAISHDLKTPITRMRLRIEMCDESPFKNKLSKDLNDMESMVHTTLEYMRGNQQKENSQTMNIMALCESMQDDYFEMGMQFKINGSAKKIKAQPSALKRCLTNLLDNALRYSNDVSLILEDSDNQLTIKVQDKGIGLTKEQIEKVFDPFYRVESSRSRETGGTGLGLSIARNIARAHGGDLVLNSKPGFGVTAILTLPR